ncbi:hypothetical protein Mal52_52170 [Symmachiella dynata]|uniref:GYF domain-containing protein n=1 Tax=Symmachiella dynata TaxID=2527995 RepID=A0A517ZW98_9PLAN|nr:hypothetical protein [Symmachiella dynata]QDU46695.1 hypothetical protein Mal52_52170 [Symmachiella dynata]
MAEKWYVRSPDGDRGPFEFPEVLGLIRTGNLGGDDDIKCTLEGHWIKAGAIDLDAAEGTGNAEALAKATRPGKRRSAASASSPPQSSWFENIYEAITDRLGPRFLWVVVIIGVWLGINFFIVRMMNPYEAERTYLKQFVTIRDELLRHRQAELSEAEWAAFSTQSRAEVQRIVGKLKRGATAEHPVRRHLLWAGNDCLLPGLQDAEAFTPEIEQRFERYMNQALMALNASRSQ